MQGMKMEKMEKIALSTSFKMENTDVKDTERKDSKEELRIFTILYLTSKEEFSILYLS